MPTYVATYTQTGISGSNNTTPLCTIPVPTHSLVNASGSIIGTYQLIGACWSLDGNPPVGINSLPPGFQVTSGTIRKPSDCTVGFRPAAFMHKVQAATTIVGGINATSNPLIFPTPSSQVCNLLSTNVSVPSPTYTPGSYAAISIAGVVIITINLTWDPADILAQASMFDTISLDGNYTTLGFNWTLDPPSGSTVNSNTPGHTDDGDLITISSNPLDPLALLLDQLTLSVACGSVIIKTQTANLLEFYIPSSCGVAGGSTVLTATGNGVQFSGSVSLGQLIVLATNGSGIYVVTPGNAHDVLYSSVRDGTTRNVKIPRPFGKTGFIGA